MAAQKVSISLHPQHIRAVERYGREIGVDKFSVALQMIIHQFEQSRKEAKAASETAAEQSTESVPA